MGWTYPTGVSRKELIQQRTRSWEREIKLPRSLFPGWQV